MPLLNGWLNRSTKERQKRVDALRVFRHKLRMPFDPVEFIERHSWTFAKTMPDNPHEYVVRSKVQDDASFDAMVRHIREHGRPAQFGKLLYLHWEHEGQVYWTMGWPVDETIIINRAKVEDSEAVPVDPRIVTDHGHGRVRWSSKDRMRPPL